MKAETLHSLMRDLEVSDIDSRMKTLRRLKSICLVYYSDESDIDFRYLLANKSLNAASSSSCRLDDDNSQVIEDYLQVIKKFLEEESDDKIDSIKLPIIRNASTSLSFYNKIFEEIKRAYPNLTTMTLIFEDYKYMKLIFSVSVNINFPNIKSLEIFKTNITGAAQNPNNQTRCLLEDRELDVDDIVLRFPNVKYLNLEGATVFFGKSKQSLKPPMHQKKLDNLTGLTIRLVNKSVSHLLEMAPNLKTLQITFVDGELCSGYKYLHFLEPFKIKNLICEVYLQSRVFKFQQPPNDLAITKTSTNKSLNIFDRKIIPLFKNIENISFVTRNYHRLELARLSVNKESDDDEEEGGAAPAAAAAAAAAAEDDDVGEKKEKDKEEEEEEEKEDRCSFCCSSYDEI